MATQQASYALGHSKQELDRLAQQAEAFRPFTKTLFEQAGIKAGMRVLDVGCGSGDVAFLAAEMVGDSGEVVGIDRVADAVNWANARARALDVQNVSFVEGDPTTMQFSRGFDAVVGRLVLMYYPDPVAALRRLSHCVRPGGLVVFQEFDADNCEAVPESPLFKRAANWIFETLRRTGARTRLGMELFAVYQEAGLPAPKMRHDALIGGGPDVYAYGMIAGVARSLLPAMEKLGIATASEVDIETLRDRLRDEVVAGGGVVVSPALIGAWAQKPQ
jgi:ubiquinone/menaquinone biosynthesis C-methylase UbiE